jgi:isopentenyldiphosphate isomerase
MTHTEYLDLVNKFDQVIGQAPRAWVHRNNWAHRASHLLIFNQEKKLFLQKRSPQKAIDPGRWDTSVGGHVDAGESYDACIYRETQEELGVEIAELRFWFKLDSVPTTFHEFMAVYYARHEGPFKLHPEEITDGQWFTLAEIQQWLNERPDELASSLRLILQTLAEQPGLLEQIN